MRPQWFSNANVSPTSSSRPDEDISPTDYLHDIYGELVEMRKLQERIVDALERIADGGTR